VPNDIGKRRGGLCAIRVGYIRCTYNVITMLNDLDDCERSMIFRGRGAGKSKVENKVRIKETFVRSIRSDYKETNVEEIFCNFLRILVSFQNSRFLKRVLFFFIAEVI